MWLKTRSTGWANVAALNGDWNASRRNEVDRMRAQVLAARARGDRHCLLKADDTSYFIDVLMALMKEDESLTFISFTRYAIGKNCMWAMEALVKVR